MKPQNYARGLLFIGLLFVAACQPKQGDTPRGAVFHRLPASETGIDFTNRLTEDGKFDVFRYRNYYNGGGVAIGDVNNDGLPDIYLTANCDKNRLFLNKGNFQFEDITDKAGVGGVRAWSTGVTMADVNADGWLDIYVCNSGSVEGDDQQNELFINNGQGGIPTFTEQGAAYGLDDQGFGTHAVFFDYDLDNDLDCYVLNNSFRPVSTLGEVNLRTQIDEKGGDKLYRNDGGKFVNVTQQAGIFSSVIGFGLGVTVGDVNLDGWPDLYISNDFHERDYFYINNKNGAFRECLPQYFDHISLSSMGADLADINNDGLPEIFSTDMLPEDNRRLKQLSTFQSYDVYQRRIQLDFYHQFMSNMLHLHNGLDARGNLLPYTEVAELTGVDATDWSWGALMADFDNDGRRDILVCNGIYKDVTDQDFLVFLSSDKNMDAAMRGEKVDFQKWIDKIPSEKISNYLFTRSDNTLRFTNAAQQWGLGEPSFSNGAAYGDLDNDGDLDLVVNNVNQELFVYRNETQATDGHHYLRVKFQGQGANTQGIGALLYLYRGGEILAYEHYPIRGFQSSMDYTAIIGLGPTTTIDSAAVWWPGGKRQVLTNLQADTEITLRADQAAPGPGPAANQRGKKALFQDVTAAAGLKFKHQENPHSDFDAEQMLYNMQSAEGPALAAGDLNGDGLEDIFVGGAKDQAGAVFLQKPDGAFAPSPQPALEADKVHEDVDAVFFDADADGDPDLYVASGGSEFYNNTALLQGRLYLNQNGRLTKAPDNIPSLNNLGSCARAADFDGDGDIDLFLGTRAVPGYYGQAADSYLLENDGSGKFTDATRLKASGLRRIGLVTDAAWTDLDGDKRPELIVVGEWMAPTIFKNDNGKLVKSEQYQGFAQMNGLWRRILPVDLDGDGDTDFVAGNLGENGRFQASAADPLSLYVSDFDKNGSLDQVFCYRQNGKTYPMTLLHDLVKRLPFLKKRFLYYKEYATRTIEEIFTPEELKTATLLQAHTLASTAFINEGGNRFNAQPLPDAAQVAPVYGLAAADFDGDQKTDLFLAGNLFQNKPEIGRLDGLYGLVLSGPERRPLPLRDMGAYTREAVRHVTLLKSRIVLAQNNAPVLIWKY